MQSETGFPSSHQLKSYVAYKSRLKLAARPVLSADAGLLVGVSNMKGKLAMDECKQQKPKARLAVQAGWFGVKISSSSRHLVHSGQS